MIPDVLAETAPPAWRGNPDLMTAYFVGIALGGRLGPAASRSAEVVLAAALGQPAEWAEAHIRTVVADVRSRLPEGELP